MTLSRSFSTMILPRFLVLLLLATHTLSFVIRRKSRNHFRLHSTVVEEPRSAFETHEYWDDMYAGRGDFPADEYSWYYGFEVVGKVVREYLSKKNQKLLVPGIGNDPILKDLHPLGYQITAQDYSENAIERQKELLEFEGISDIELCVGDVRQLDEDWTHAFDAILEKGLLDAVYLSGDGNVERAVDNFQRVLKPGGHLMSFSGVVPHELRQQLFTQDKWECLRDGSDDLKAGTFVYKLRF